MANEISVSGRLSFVKGSSAGELISGLLTPTMTGSNYQKHRQTIGTSEEVLVVPGDAGTLGLIMAINRDVTNYVELLAASGAQAFAKMLPGEFALFRAAAGATYYGKANTGACELEYLVLEL